MKPGWKKCLRLHLRRREEDQQVRRPLTRYRRGVERRAMANAERFIAERRAIGQQRLDRAQAAGRRESMQAAFDATTAELGEAAVWYAAGGVIMRDVQ